MQKFSSQLPKDDLKKFAKEVGKKLVASDFKNNRVEDPTKISEKQEKKVKAYVREFFEKAVQKKKAIDKKKREKEKANGVKGSSSKDKELAINGTGKAEVNGKKVEQSPPKEDIDMEMSEDDDKDLAVSFPIEPSPSIPATPAESTDLKRKREEDELGTPCDDYESNKRQKEDEPGDSPIVSPPPPPPPPPSGMPDPSSLEDDSGVPVEHVKEETEEDRELRLQEEELMRENEEAMKMDLDGSLQAEEKDAKLHDHSAALLHNNGISEKDMEDVEADIKQERASVLSH